MNVLPRQARKQYWVDRTACPVIRVARGVDPVMESGCQSNHNHAVAGDWEKNQNQKKIFK
jgi:hypothetical protein